MRSSILIACCAIAIVCSGCQETVAPDRPKFARAYSYSDSLPAFVTVNRVPEGYRTTHALQRAQLEILHRLRVALRDGETDAAKLYAEADVAASTLGNDVAASAVRQATAQILLLHFGPSLPAEHAEHFVRLLITADSPNARAIGVGLQRLRSTLPLEERRALARASEQNARAFLQRRCPECLNATSPPQIPQPASPEADGRDRQVAQVMSGLHILESLQR